MATKGKKNVFDNMKNLDMSYLMDPSLIEEEIEAKASKIDQEEIEISRLISFKNHPFRVDEESEQFNRLKESIEELGVLSPILVRPLEDRYEIISGHCRTRAAELVGLKTVPAKVVPMDDYQATVIMTHSNIVGRDSILISEKAKAYRMCIEQQKANGMTKGEAEQLVGGENDSKRSVQRLVRLSYLNDDLLNLIDSKRMAAQIGYEIAFLDDLSQDELMKYINTTEKIPTLEQAKQLRGMFENGVEITFEKIVAELTNISKKPKVANKVIFKTKEIAEYFDEGTDAEAMTNVIITLLEKYSNGEFGDIFE